jgi:hypothetical protein
MELTNPYHMRGMIPIESDMFFGRESEMRRIGAMLSGEVPQCVSIIGERRIGKSSLAFRVFHRMRNAGNTLAVFLDCDQLSRHCQTEEQFFAMLQEQFSDAFTNQELIKKFCRGGEKREAEKLGRWEDGKPRSELCSISRTHPETDENQHQRFAQHIGSPRRGAPGRRRQEKLFNDYATFRDFLKKIGGNQVRTIIFMDEFEHLPGKSFADETFFSNLRSAANSPDHRLAFVTISRTGLKELTQCSIRTSGFWNIFEPEIIGLLDSKSIDGLRRHKFVEKDFSLSREEIERMAYYGGDFPFFNQVVCSWVWDAKVSRSVPDWDDLEVRFSSYYKKLWEDRAVEEQKLLKKLKGKEEDFSLKEMKARGILIKKDNFYRPFSDYFSRLIKNNTLVIKREKMSFKKIMQHIKNLLAIIKTGKEIVTDKGE